MIKSFLAIALLLAIPKAVLAAPMTLSDGLFYNQDGNVCGLQVVNNQANGELVLGSAPSITRLPCTTSYVFNLKRSADSKFQFTKQIIVAKDYIARCTSTRDWPKPCTGLREFGISIYDEKTGKLLIQEGDVIILRYELSILNPNTFVLVGDSRWTRGSTIIQEAVWLEGQLFSSSN